MTTMPGQIRASAVVSGPERSSSAVTRPQCPGSSPSWGANWEQAKALAGGPMNLAPLRENPERYGFPTKV